MVKRFLLAAFLIVAVFPVQAEWVAIGANAEKGERYFFDPETTQNNGQLRKAWVLSNYDEIQVGGHQSVKTFYEFDCTDSKVRSVTMLLYSDLNAVGNVVGAHHKEKPEPWTHFSPSSIFNVLSETLCAVD
ncbi:MAG: hypothetical protein OEX82_06610 [Nitrosomonas sp.]|nr:hypothetical protein [Nitrosomonas sp.]